MQLCCIIVTIGTTVQTASINIGMFLAGRGIAGIAVGGMVSTVPIYLSEISAPHQRGLIGGISGCGMYIVFYFLEAAALTALVEDVSIC